MTNREQYCAIERQIKDLQKKQKQLYSGYGSKSYYDILLDNILITINPYYNKGVVHRHSSVECAYEIRSIYMRRLGLSKSLLFRDEYEQALLMLNNYKSDDEVLNFLYY